MTSRRPEETGTAREAFLTNLSFNCQQAVRCDRKIAFPGSRICQQASASFQPSNKCVAQRLTSLQKVFLKTRSANLILVPLTAKNSARLISPFLSSPNFSLFSPFFPFLGVFTHDPIPFFLPIDNPFCLCEYFSHKFPAFSLRWVPRGIDNAEDL